MSTLTLNLEDEPVGNTHSMLIVKAAAWLRAKSFPVVITDMSHCDSETPDAIGWKFRTSTVIECKSSRSDFKADAKKYFRRDSAEGMGVYRYYCVNEGLIKWEELPEKWGLLEWDGKKLRETVKPKAHREVNHRSETSLLVSALRRVALAAPEGISVRCYKFQTRSRATLGVMEVES